MTRPAEMVERVARAAYADARNNSWGSEGPFKTWEEQQEAVRQAYLRNARISIEAMMLPTEAMVLAGVVRLMARDTGDAGKVVDDMWPAMIAAALDEGGT